MLMDYLNPKHMIFPLFSKCLDHNNTASYDPMVSYVIG